MSGPEPPDPAQREEVELWLQRAAEDVAGASFLVQESYALPASFHTQQALEKLLKALLIRARQDIRRTHDLDALASEARRFWPTLIPAPFPLVNITHWYLPSRHPDADDAPPGLKEIAEALAEIRDLLSAVGTQLGL